MFGGAAQRSGSKEQFLEQAKAARQERACERRREQAASTLQAAVRGFLCRQRLRAEFRREFDAVLPQAGDEEASPAAASSVLEVFCASRKFLFTFQPGPDKERFERLCRYIVASMDADTLQESYVSVSLMREHAVLWIQQLKAILGHCCGYLRDVRVRPSGLLGGREASAFLLLLLPLPHCSPSAHRTPAPSCCSSTCWSPLRAPLPGICSGARTAGPVLSVMNSHGLFRRCLDLLLVEQNMRILFNALEGNYALCLLANLVHLAHLNAQNLSSRLLDFVHVATRLLESCQKYVVNKRSNLTHWHPILGWFAQSIDHGLHESLSSVRQQLQLLWSGPLVGVLFQPLADLLAQQGDEAPPPDPASPAASSTAGLLKKALGSLSAGRGSGPSGGGGSTQPFRRLGSPEVSAVALVCALLQAALASLSQLRLDILTGLCHQEWVLCGLWRLIRSVGPPRAFLDLLAITSKASGPEFLLLQLFCDCATHLLTILDDLELYEQQRPFTLQDLVALSAFLNLFVFRLLWAGLIDVKSVGTHPLFCSCHTLLMLLYKRDCRRSYTPPDHWLIKDVKVSVFMAELDKGKKAAQVLLQKVPHIIPHKERVVLFRKYVANEKAVLGLTESACALSQSTLITVHRTRIVEDGYQQLAMLPPQALKGVIRVRFINEQGLDEAGIDQDGVFKEFLEETIKRVFDPSLNLFRATSEQRLYPSPTSYIQENHLSLFEFVGKMLGKAVYEGIVVDVPFASFFLSQLLGHQHSALYSSIDELPSLDADLYRSLTCLKHYRGDVAELALTFSLDEDCMGQLVSHELVPGGRALAVTSANRISYLHLVAHFRMHSQIQEQAAAFRRGFRALVSPDWLTLFSTPELQRLIAGDNAPVDLHDLRRHTKYFGGFHSGHRLVGWLWDVLERDFSAEEHRLFLKFVTSCSKPPLLGFAHLEPPFSIRCVEVSDDQDTGDTIGSVIRGFFTIRKRDPVNRLPTSSTCFNLLKLPNYQRKSTLRDKLRYAITSNTGFELS